MKKSKFQIINPRLVELKYKVNTQFTSNEDIELNVNSNTAVEKSEENAIVRLTLKIFTEEEFKTVPFSLEICMAAEFIWDKDIDETMCNDLLRMNAPAVLLSYARPYISQLTSGSGYPPLILPLVDFTDSTMTLEKNNKEN